MLALLACAAQTAEPLPRIVVVDDGLVLERVAPDGATIAETAATIPAEIGACYRWFLRVKPRAAVALVNERLELPAPAERWGGVDGEEMTPTRLSADRRVATTSLILPLSNGLLTNGWCYAEGDPVGAYRIDVTVNGRPARRFDFTVGP